MQGQHKERGHRLMESFWAQVDTVVQGKIGITDAQYSKALEEQKDTIVELLSFYCYPENAMEIEIAETKKEILKLYTDTIAPTISKIEVYSHDLDAGAVEAIFQLLQQITAAELEKDIATKKELYQKTLSYCYFLKHMVQKDLAELYFERIKTYEKIIKDFNYRGVHIQKDPSAQKERFDKAIKNRLRIAKKKYRESEKVYKTYIKMSDGENAYLRLDNVQNDVGFDGVISMLEDLVKTYTDNFHEIIDNGYNMSFCYRLIVFFLEIVSGGLLVYGFLKYFNFWQPIVNWVVNLVK